MNNRRLSIAALLIAAVMIVLLPQSAMADSTDETDGVNEINATNEINEANKVNETKDSEVCGETSEPDMEASSESFSIKAKYLNRYAKVTWSSVSRATYYILYRRTGGAEKRWTKVGKTKKCSYKDMYCKFKTKAQRSAIKKGLYIDPSLNRTRYSVRAFRGGKCIGSTGSGCCNIVTPVIIDVKRSGEKATVTWGRVFNAARFKVYGASVDENGKKVWKLYKAVKSAKKEKQAVTVTVPEDVTYFGVQAVFSCSGKAVTSDWEQNFSISGRNYSSKKMVVIGDSIPYGAPYKDDERRGLYTYPHRVAELTGMTVSNRSRGGSIYPKKTGIPSLVNISSKIDFSRFDVVLLTAGSNDYGYSVKLGKLKSTSLSTENGALNKIIRYIKAGNRTRAEKGKEPVKIVFVDLFYSHRAGKVFGSRFVKKNKLGLTLKDYQKNINRQIKKYRKEGLSVYRFSHNIVNSKNYRTALTDDIHLTKVFYAEVGNELSDFLVSEGVIANDRSADEKEVK